MQRRKLNRELKIEAVKLVRERGVSVAQIDRDLNVQRAAQADFMFSPLRSGQIRNLRARVAPGAPVQLERGRALQTRRRLGRRRRQPGTKYPTGDPWRCKIHRTRRTLA